MTRRQLAASILRRRETERRARREWCRINPAEWILRPSKLRRLLGRLACLLGLHRWLRAVQVDDGHVGQRMLWVCSRGWCEAKKYT